MNIDTTAGGHSVSQTAGGVCQLCGQSYHQYTTHGEGTCVPWRVARYQFTPNQLTEDDVRRIIREELERAKEKP